MGVGVAMRGRSPREGTDLSSPRISEMGLIPSLAARICVSDCSPILRGEMS